MKRLRCNREGFTIAELLVATAITTLIVLLLGQVFSSAIAMWQMADQRTDAFRDARAALQLMANDLGRANTNGNANMLMLVPGPGNYAVEADAVTPIKNSGKSDLCTVEYYLLWDGTSKTFSLMRRLKDSNATIYYLANASPNFTAIFDKSSGAAEAIARPIWDLEIRPGVADVPLASVSGSSTTWKWIEISFKAMSPNSAKKLAPMANVDQAFWDNTGSSLYKTLILPYEHQFVTRISLDQNR